MECAQLTSVWSTQFWALGAVLGNIDPYQASRIENIEAALNRWKDFEIYDGRGDEKKPTEGHFIGGLTLADEFRCMFACVFGSLKGDVKAVATSGIKARMHSLRLSIPTSHLRRISGAFSKKSNCKDRKSVV